jgi:hypothetical protein
VIEGELLKVCRYLGCAFAEVRGVLVNAVMTIESKPAGRLGLNDEGRGGCWWTWGHGLETGTAAAAPLDHESPPWRSTNHLLNGSHPKMAARAIGPIGSKVTHGKSKR